MPSSNTTDSSKTSVSLSGKSGNSESLDGSGITFTSGDSNDINHFVVLEDFSNGDFAFEFSNSPVNFLSDSASVNLDFKEVSLDLSEVKFVHLGLGEDSDDSAELLYSLKISLDGFLALVIFFISVGILGESLLLGSHPVLVESSLKIISDVLGPHGGEGSKTSGGFDVTNETDDLHGRALNDGDWVDDVLFNGLLSFSLLVMSGDVSHTSLVSDKGGKMNGLGSIISGEGSYSSSVVSCPPSGEESERAVSWLLVLSVRHSIFPIK